MKISQEKQAEDVTVIPTFLKRNKSSTKSRHVNRPSRQKDHPIHPDVVAEWITYQKEEATAYGKIVRSHKSSPDEKAIALRKQTDAKSYIKEMNHYLRTGDWISNVWGPDGSNRTLWRKVAS